MKISELKEFAAHQSQIINNNNLAGYDTEKRILHAAVKANEEMGELCNEVLKSIGSQRKIKQESATKSELEGEVADVFFTVSILADLLEIDIERALENKMEVIRSRYDDNGKERAND